MGAKTEIAWADSTWSPIRGCSRVSPGCEHCYAETMSARRLPGLMSPTTGEPLAIRTPSGPRWTRKVELIESGLTRPLRWKRGRRVFVNSMSDTFHEAVPDEWIDRIMAVGALCPQHTLLVLTKRSERQRDYWQLKFGHFTCEYQQVPAKSVSRIVPFSNLWCGVSVEDSARKFRIDHLRETPAALRFLSLEPLLEDLCHIDLRGIGWVIVGGESGPDARPMHPDWARSIRDQCVAADVPFFFKQWGAYCKYDQLPEDTARDVDAAGSSDDNGPLRVGAKTAGHLLDGREWQEFPASTTEAAR